MKPKIPISNSVATNDLSPGQIDQLNDEAFSLRHEDTKRSASLASEAAAASKKIKYKKGEATALLNLGFHEFINSRYQDAFSIYSDALALFDKAQDDSGEAHTKYNIALIHLRTGDYDAAMALLQESYRIRKELNDENGVASCKSQIAYLNSQFGQDDTALSDYSESLAIWRRMDNKAGIGNVLMTLGILYTKQNKLKEADQSLRESLRVRQDIGERNGIHGSANYLSAVLLKEARYQESLDLLIPILEEAISQEHPYHTGISRLRLSLAKTYTALQDYANAFSQLEQALESALKLEQNYQLPDIYYELMAICKHTGDFRQALFYYEKYHLAKETVLNLNAASRLKNLEAINALRIREQEVESQRLKNAALSERNKIIREERKVSESLLLNILPKQTAAELKKFGKTRPRHYDVASVLFTDFVKFTTASEQLTAGELVKRLDIYFRTFDEIISKYKIEKIKTIGDSYMAAAGVPDADPDHPVRIVRAALAIRDFVIETNDPLFNVRIGIHTGGLIAGVVGSKKFAYDVWGDTVNIASRMESSGESGRVNISGVTHALVKDAFVCEYRGKVAAKNKGMIDMYFVNE